MLRLIALALVFISVNGALLGSKKCTWGPSYWCENFEQAEECSATQHCHEKVWTQKGSVSPAVDDESDVCTYCKDMISDVKNFIESNKTQATIRQYMNRACDFLPDTFSMQECKKIEQHYLDQFEQCIRDNVDPDAICKLTRLCPQNSKQTQKAVPSAQSTSSQFSRVDLKSAVISLKTNDDTLCAPCKQFMEMAKTEISDEKTQAAIKTFLTNECNQLGGDLVSECQMFVTMLLPEVFTMLEKELGDQMCVTLGLCQSTDLSTAVAIQAAKDRLRAALRSSTVRMSIQKAAGDLKDGACDDCEMIAGYLKIFLSNNATEQELQQLLENDVCSQLGSFSDVCKTLVEQYTPQLFSLLLQELDPATICTEIGLCTTTPPPSTTTAAPAVSETRVRVKASPTCLICEFVMSKLESTLSDNATEEEIIHGVEKVCSILPSTVEQECKDLIDKYGSAIINLLVQDVSPTVICTTLGLCSSGDSMYKKPLGDEACSVCELALKYLESMLEKNATQQEVLHAVEKVCNFLSGDIAQQCNSMIEMYGPSIIKLVTDMDTKQVCTTIGLCKPNTKVDGLVHLYNRADNY